MFLLSEGFGLAIPEPEYILTPRGNLIKFNSGSQQIHYPVVEMTFNKNCTEIYQPILDSELILSSLNATHKRKVFINENSGNGKIFYLKDGELKRYPIKKTKNWIPPSFNISFLEFFRLIGIQTLEIQNYYFTKGTMMFDTKLEPEFKKQKKFALSVNNIL